MIDLDGFDLSAGPSFVLRNLIEKGRIKEDAVQEKIMQAMQKIFENKKHGFSLKMLSAKHQKNKGVYLHGKVGRGKTMMMDIFFQTLPKKEAHRVHFHEFMKDVHGLLNRLRRKKDRHDIIKMAAADLSKNMHILCLDEFEVSDIADAMLLERLFNALFEKGVILVTTSNFSPEELYKDGLQRQSFLPFLDLLDQNCDILSLASPHDYRRKFLVSSSLWFSPRTQRNTEKFQDLFLQTTKGVNAVPRCFETSGRKLHIPKVAGNIAYTDFGNLCMQPRGGEDYAFLAKRFYILFIEGIPPLDETLRNEAKRFMILIDVFYDQGKTVLGYSETEIGKLYVGHSHAFEFLRTVSRLYEMHDPEHFNYCHEVVRENRLKEAV